MRSGHGNFLIALALLCCGACGGPGAPSAPARLEGLYAFRHPFHPQEIRLGYGDAVPGAAADSSLRWYVHDGEWDLRDGRPAAVRGQSYPESAPGPVMLVYHAAPAFIDAFAALAPADVVEPIAGRVADLRNRGLPVIGVQFDFDLGPRGLAALPSMLRLARERMPDARLSVTALLDPADDPAWTEISPLVDEVCPMLYGYATRGETATFDVPRARRFLRTLRVPRGQCIPVVPWWSTGADLAAAQALLDEEDIPAYLLFQLTDRETLNGGPRHGT